LTSPTRHDTSTSRILVDRLHLRTLLSSHHFIFFFFNDTATTEIYTLSLHDALPICGPLQANEHLVQRGPRPPRAPPLPFRDLLRSEEHTSELQSRGHLVCRLLLEKKKEQTQCTTMPARSVTTDATRSVKALSVYSAT